MAGNKKTRAIVGISGGVDSAVAALLLLRAGYDVQGLHMSNWDNQDAYCTAAQDYQDARQICADLGIPLHRVNFAREYREQVFADFLNEFRHGRTPNPDIACNRQIKFGTFLEYASRLGAARIATGHYARMDRSAGSIRLLKGVDCGKDQSYFLHAVRRRALEKSLFPLGELRKSEVRRMANDFGLKNYAKPDSTGICFIGERPFREFLRAFLPATPGTIETPDGDPIGSHQGLMYYTVGQRQGLEIGGIRGYPASPWYVAGKDLARNALIVVQGREHPLLWSAGVVVDQVHWIAGNPPAPEFDCSVKTRYRQEDAACRVESQPDESLAVEFAEAQWAVTPGQYAVFYQDDECLGGGPIQQALAPVSAPAAAAALSA